MKRSIVVVALTSIVMAAVALWIAPHRSDKAQATGMGPQIEVGAPSLMSGKVRVPIVTTGSGFAAYSGFNIHLRWAPSVFSFSSYDTTGTILTGTPFCTSNTATYDSDGGGVVLGCAFIGGSPASSTGLLATLVLTPAVSGCSSLHLFTLGGVDAGTSGSGTYTTNPTSQTNTYLDGTANVAGMTCVPAGSPTPTPTPSLTPTPTNTATPTNTPTATNTPLVGFPDVTVSGLSVPTSGDGGTTVAYSLIVSNIGSVTATGVMIDVTVPMGGVPFKNVLCKAYTAGHFFCSLPNLPAGMQEGAVLNMQLPIVAASGTAVAPIHVSATNEPAGNQGNNNGQVTTSVRGCPDLDGDDVISIIDLSDAALSYLLSMGQPGYNPLADQDGDHMITLNDITLIASRYGQHCHGTDSDHDGLSDSDETNVYHTNPNNPDSDADGLPDGVDVLTYGANPLSADTDIDGYTDSEEAALGKDPTIYCQIMASDLDHDHTVTIVDLSNAALSYLLMTGQPGFNPAADLNHDGRVDIIDISIIAGNYLKNVSQCP